MTTTSVALKAIIQAALDTAREEAAKQEVELGRKLTNAEAMQLAQLVERQLKVALTLKGW